MTYRQHIHIYDQSYGIVERGLKMVHGTRVMPLSFVWVCPGCAEAWAKAPLYLDGKIYRYQVQGGYCHRCQPESPYNVAGSLLLSWDEEWNTALMTLKGAVKREFELHCHYQETRND